MIERVARAIYESRNGNGCRPWSIQPKAHKSPYLDDARAAMGAIRDIFAAAGNSSFDIAADGIDDELKDP